MIQKVTILILISFYSALGNAQKITGFFDQNWRACDAKIAAYYAETEKRDSLWYRVDYNARNSKLLKHGTYKDDHTQIRHGRMEYFFSNGSISEIQHYTNNKKTGQHLKTYPSGFLSDSFQFKKDLPYGICISWYPDGSVKTEMQLDTLGNGSGVVIGFFPDGNISFKGQLAPGLRKAGNWFYYHANGKKASVLQYGQPEEKPIDQTATIYFDEFENAYYDSTVKYENAICYDTVGVQQPECKLENQAPQYPGGVKEWTKYLTNYLFRLMSRHGNLQKQIVYINHFIVKPDGELDNIMLDNTFNQSLDDDVKGIFIKSKKWIPARHNNRIIPMLSRQSLTLAANN